METPDLVDSVTQLDELLTRPNAAVAETVRRLNGNFLVLGAGGKMGPTLTVLAKRAAQAASVEKRVVAVSRFTNQETRRYLEKNGVEITACDLFDERALAKLPDAQNVVYMVGTKFGSTGRAHETWAVNAFLPGVVLRRFSEARFVVFSTGNVYPMAKATSSGPKETDAVAPIGEYAQSALARERIVEFFSRKLDMPAAVIRLNYAIDLRYGVLLDVAQKVLAKEPIDLSMGYVNVIWQGDANAFALRAFELADSPPFVLNVTGKDRISIRHLAERFGDLLGVKPVFQNSESETALLSDASLCYEIFGEPEIDLSEMIAWTAHWLKIGGPTLGKPTRYEVRDGKF